MPLPLRAHSLTHPGLHHPRNEDTYTVLPTREGGLLLVVCDGMGGMGRGDEASKLAVDVLSEEMARNDGLPPERMRNSLRIADQRVREELCEEGGELPGTTAVMVYVLDGAAHVAWVGDSRAYLIRDGRVVFRTRDHKLVEELVDAGQLTPEEARESALAHVVTRALGGRSVNEPTVHPATLGYPWKLQHDDRILLCSDGVCDLLDDDEISDLLADATPADATSRLVEASLMRGGHDNITCIVAVWDGASWVDEESTPVMVGERQATPASPPVGLRVRLASPSGGRVEIDEVDVDVDEPPTTRFVPDSPTAEIVAIDEPDPTGRVTEEIDLRSLREGGELFDAAAEFEDIADLPTAEVPRPTGSAPAAARPPGSSAAGRFDTRAQPLVLTGLGLLVLAALLAVFVAL
jgi:PPM family protein phosphatase